MPISGSLNVTPLLEAAPQMRGFDAEPWDTPGVEILHLKFEIDDRDMAAPLPRALHPTIPPTVIFTVATYPESPVGPFALAQVRVGARASGLPRGFLTRAYCDSAKACEALASNWGFDCHQADVRLKRYHDRIIGGVNSDGAEILRISLIDPEPISGGDVQFVANMNLARDAEGNGALVQVDPNYAFHKAERGKPEIEAFNQVAWRSEGVVPVWPIAATWTLCDTGFPKIRFVLDPDQPARTGTRKLV